MIKTIDNNFRMVLCYSLHPLALVGLLAYSLSSIAQDDPFGGAGAFGNNQFGDAANADTSSPPPSKTNANALPDDNNPVVQSIRQNPPKTSRDLGRAILYLSRINRWAEIGNLIDRLVKRPLSGPDALELSRAAGPETLLALSMNSFMKEAQRAAIRKIMDQSIGQISDAKLLVSASESLRATTKLDRKKGAMTLQAAGDAGISALIQSVLKDEREPAAVVSEVIEYLGEDGTSALRAALITSQPKDREKLGIVASRIPGREFIGELSALLYSIDPKSTAYDLVKKSLSPQGESIPTQERVQSFLTQRIKTLLSDYRQSLSDTVDSNRNVWRWNGQTKSFQNLFVTREEAIIEQAAQLSSHLVQMAYHDSTLPPPIATAVLLEHEYYLNSVVQTASPLTSPIVDLTNTSKEEEYLTMVVDQARSEQLSGAELRAVSAIGQLLSSNSPSDRIVSELAASAASGSQSARYAATVALLTKLPSDYAYAGKSTVEKVKSEMLRLESRPLAMIVGGSPSLRDTLASQLTDIGIANTEAANAREAIQLGQNNQPIELIFICDRVMDMRISELIQRFQSNPRLTRVPVFCLTEQIDGPGKSLLTSDGSREVVFTSLTNNVDLTAATINQMTKHKIPPRLDSVDRITWKSTLEPSTTK